MPQKKITQGRLFSSSSQINGASGLRGWSGVLKERLLLLKFDLKFQSNIRILKHNV